MAEVRDADLCFFLGCPGFGKLRAWALDFFIRAWRQSHLRIRIHFTLGDNGLSRRPEPCLFPLKATTLSRQPYEET